MKKYCTVIILAGGNSSRMKFPKAYLMLEGKTFVEKIADEYIAAGFEQIIMVLNTVFSTGEWSGKFKNIPGHIHIIRNYFPDKGRLYSIQAGLVNETSAEFCFIQNIDNPFISSTVINTLWNNKSVESSVIPVFKGKGGHPVLIPSKIINTLKTSKPENSTLKDILDMFPRTYVETNEKDILLNINTPEDYNKIHAGEHKAL